MPPKRVFTAHLAGDQEVPPVETEAVGVALLVQSVDHSRLKVFLKVAHIDDVFAAHIHCAPVGTNGPIGLTLFAGGPVSIEQGFLVLETFTEPNPGNACGWVSLADMVDALESGDTYINVHTSGHPSGEIRGQVR
jgi:hypothetical protein